jgi:hypothetical protein
MNGNKILQLLFFLCSATPALLALASAGPGESDSLQAADSSELAPPMQSTAAKKIVKTMEVEDVIASPSSSSSSTSILSKIHPLLLIKAIDAIRRDRVESWTRSSNRRLQECMDVFTWTSKSGKGKGGKSDEQEEDASFLYVQMADQCTFEQWKDGTYRFYSSDFHASTYEFTDMPFEEERELSTGEFFSEFHSVYFQENEHPNTSFTLVDNDNSDGVVVSALASAFVEYANGEQAYGYVLDQSDSQRSVRSLSDVLDGGSEKTHDHCSLFIDNARANPRPPLGPRPPRPTPKPTTPMPTKIPRPFNFKYDLQVKQGKHEQVVVSCEGPEETNYCCKNPRPYDDDYPCGLEVSSIPQEGSNEGICECPEYMKFRHACDEDYSCDWLCYGSCTVTKYALPPTPQPDSVVETAQNGDTVQVEVDRGKRVEISCTGLESDNYCCRPYGYYGEPVNGYRCTDDAKRFSFIPKDSNDGLCTNPSGAGSDCLGGCCGWMCFTSNDGSCTATIHYT